MATASGPGQCFPLAANWRMRKGIVKPDAVLSGEPSDWIEIPVLQSVAAALRGLGLWSLDSPTRCFDAEEWSYHTRFDAPQRGNEVGRTVLCLNGLATVATVWLNGRELLQSSNMFVAHEIDVTGLLAENDNDLLIHFSALDAVLARQRKRPRWRAPMVGRQQLRWYRTTLLGRTPGWSPPAAVVGPWKDISLERRDLFEAKDVQLRATLDGEAGVASCQVRFQLAGPSAIVSCCLRLERSGQVFLQKLGQSRDDSCLFTGNLRIDNADLWWPHTHGEPSLYRTSLTVCVADQSEEFVLELAPTGFRTVTVDTSHSGFVLSVNGVEVFCRGACWTPLDPVSLRSTQQACRKAVAQARSAGMNMLRVAGTMVYEEDHFYQSCDEQGMLVWQEFMFANMDYPEDDVIFLKSVETEAYQLLNRLSPRPCIAVLCGNNEVSQQAAMWGAPRDQWEPALFANTLAELCKDRAPHAFYWPSSASGGSFPHQADAGTTSYYGVGAYLRPLEDARRSALKFATECLAFANVPGTDCLARMPGGLATRVHHASWKERSPRDMGAGWDFDDVRDHYLEKVFNTDAKKLRSVDHEHYLTLARIATGEVMATSFGEWRKPGSVCRGALILFLRDLWAGAGWGLIDDQGAPKACYYHVKRAMQPVAVFISDEGVNGVAVHLINEKAEGRQVELELSAWREGDVRVAFGEKSLNLPARSSRSFSGIDLLGYFMDLNHAYQFGPMTCDALAVTLRDGTGMQLSRAFLFPGGLSARPESDVGLRARAAMVDPDTVLLTVHTRRFAQAVYFDTPGFCPEDEFFHLPPASTAQVIFRRTGEGAFAGSVHAVNSSKCSRIELTALQASAHKGAEAK